MKLLKQGLATLLLAFTTYSASAATCEDTVITGGELEYFSVVTQEISLSTDGVNYDVILLSEETELNTVGLDLGVLTDAAQNSAIPAGTYTHLRMGVSGHGIKGWVTDETDMWYTVTNSTGQTITRVDDTTTAPTAPDYGKTLHTFDGATFTMDLKLLKPLEVTAGATSTLILTENTELITDLYAEFGGDVGSCELGFLARGDMVYYMFATEVPARHVMVQYAGTGANEGKMHSLSMLFDASDNILAAYIHAEDDLVVDGSRFQVLTAGTNLYNQEFDISFQDYESGSPVYRYTGNYTCAGGGSSLFIYENDVLVTDVNSTGTVVCVAL